MTRKRAVQKLSEQELIEIIEGETRSTSATVRITAAKLLVEYRAGAWPKRPVKGKRDDVEQTPADELLAARKRRASA